MQKALVTGANGFIGSALTRRLLADGVAVRAMCRNPSKAQFLAEAGAEVVAGDVQDSPTVHRHADGCDVVFHVAAAMTGAGAAVSYNVNVQGTRYMVHAAQQVGVTRYVHVSSVAVYGYDIDGLVDESHEQRPSRDDFYGQSKALGEQTAWAYARRMGLPMVSIRPAFVYGPGSQFWSRQMYKICRRYPVPLLDGGHGHAHPIYIDDVVDLLTTAATHPAAPGYAFNVAPDPAPSWKDFLGHYARMAGNSGSITIPVDSFEAVGHLVTLLSRLIGTPVDAVGGMQHISRRITYRMTRAAELLDWKPRVSLDEGMAHTEAWLKTIYSS